MKVRPELQLFLCMLALGVFLGAIVLGCIRFAQNASGAGHQPRVTQSAAR